MNQWIETNGTSQNIQRTTTNHGYINTEGMGSGDTVYVDIRIYANRDDDVYYLVDSFHDANGIHFSNYGRYNPSANITSIDFFMNSGSFATDSDMTLWKATELPSGGGSSALNDLTDVTITSATTGDYLYYNGSGWVNQTALALDGLTDVNAPSPTDEYVLEWDSGTSKWVPAVDDDTGGSSGVSSIIAGTGISVDSATGTVTITNTVSPTISIDTEELEEILILGVTSQQWGIALAVMTVVIVLAYAVVRKRR